MNRWLFVLLAVAVTTASAPAQTRSRPEPKRSRQGKDGQHPRTARPPAELKKNRNGQGRFDDSPQPLRRDGAGFAPFIDSRYGYIPTYGAFGFLNSADYLYLESGRQYYSDGPNGPGYYDQSRWYTWYIATLRSDQLLHTSRAGIDRGMAEFRVGHYDRAAIAWLGASRLNQEDAASRVHAGHALFAVGRYDSAVKLLARAFELTPRLATSSYDIRSDYTNPADFYDHLDALKRYVVRHPDDADGVTLLGYVRFYTEGPASAYRVLKRAAQLRSKDTFIPKLLEVARMVSPQADVQKDSQDKPARSKSQNRSDASAVRRESRVKQIRTDRR